MSRYREYRAYLQSPRWGYQRQRALERAGFCCEFCGQTAEPYTFGRGLQVHHLSYEQLGDEQPGDLIVLCADCHSDVHTFPKLAADVRAFAARRRWTRGDDEQMLEMLEHQWWEAG